MILHPSHGWKSSPHAPETNNFSILGGTSTNPIGAAASLFSVPEQYVAPCPPHLTSAEAAALPLTGLTAWRALVTRSGIVSTTDGADGKKAYELQPKDANLLVTGIGGGVALMALVFAVKLGAKVWVTSSSEDKIARAVKLGASGGVNYKSPTWEKELLSLLPKSRPLIDAVIDGAGSDTLVKTVRLLKLGGTFVSYGMTLSPNLNVPMSAVLKNIKVEGTTMGSHREFEDMVKFVAEREVRPVISRVVKGRLEEVEKWEELWRDMKEGRQFGKLVFEVEEGEGREGAKL